MGTEVPRLILYHPGKLEERLTELPLVQQTCPEHFAKVWMFKGSVCGKNPIPTAILAEFVLEPLEGQPLHHRTTFSILKELLVYPRRDIIGAEFVSLREVRQPFFRSVISQQLNAPGIQCARVIAGHPIGVQRLPSR